MARIRLENVSRSFGSFTAVEGLDLDVANGEFFVLLGPTGAGKTTTLRMIAGLEKPTAGRIHINEVDVNDWGPAEREEIVRLYADLLERAYVGKIEQYSGERIQFVGETAERDQATVRTRLVTKAGTEIPVDYRMHRVAGDRWLAYDVAIEGVSMVANYRAQFNKIIQTSGYPALVSRLTAKQEEGVQADRELSIRKASQTK